LGGELMCEQGQLEQSVKDKDAQGVYSGKCGGEVRSDSFY